MYGSCHSPFTYSSHLTFYQRDAWFPDHRKMITPVRYLVEIKLDTCSLVGFLPCETLRETGLVHSSIVSIPAI